MNKIQENVPSVVGNEQLLPCPFCGFDKDNAFGPRLQTDWAVYWIECSCGATQGHWATQMAAVKSWNKRV